MRIAIALWLASGGLPAQTPLDASQCRRLALTHAEEDQRDRAGRALYYQCGRDVLEDPAVAAALIRHARMGSAVAGPVLLLGFLPQPPARAELERLRIATRSVKLQQWSAPVPVSLPATVALSRLGDSDARNRLRALSEDKSLAVREFLLEAAGDLADRDLPLLLPYLDDTREIRSGVPSGAAPRRRLCDAAIVALSRRLQVTLPFPVNDARRYTDQERRIARESFEPALRPKAGSMTPPFAATLAAAVHIDFEGGSLGRIEQASPAHFRLGSKGEKDQDGRNRQANWYYFRVDGARPGQELALDIVDLPGEYNYRPNRGAITKDTPPVISYDNARWRHVETFSYDAEEPELRLRVTPEKSRFWIAHVPPYTNEHLEKLRSTIARHGAFREEKTGRTPAGRDLLLWTIGSGAKVVWLMFRQHSWEAGSSWTGEGAVLALLEDERLRRGVTWKIFPLSDPDGVARGGVRFNAHGFDLNRNWDVEDAGKMPEITAQRNAIRKWLEAGNQIDLFCSLHNTETSEYLEGPPAGHRDLAARFFDLLAKHTSFHPSRPLSFSEPSTTAGMNGRMNVAQGLSRDWKLAAFLMEQRIAYNEKLKRLPLPEDRLRFGNELVRAIWAAVTANPYP
ncbi:MAG: hypothetical protein HY235_06865 [Acidobacteria bacterium]|nr:hypothetical protein [Acidobacteriota bacterium]